jgi:GntR family transcriptional regulator / MocR family aminotransferase
VDRTISPQNDRSITSGGSDFLQLDVGQAPPGGRGVWLAARLRQAIADGRLPVGSLLPATRVLAVELGVSRGVVTDAYQRLVEDGHVAGRGRGGTVVVAAPVSVPRQEKVPAAQSLPAARIDLSPGVPDLASFPASAWLRAERAAFHALTPNDLGYGDPRGAPAMRAAVARWLARNRGIAADPQEVIITAGVTQGLVLLAQVLRANGIDTVAVEDPGSFGVRDHLRALGLKTPPIRVDADGLRVADLRDSGAPAVKVTPAHQFPMGVVLSGQRRRELMAWAARQGGLVIEDDYDAEHRYGRPPVPALRSVMPEHVCYVGSVSKLLAPALRIGWALVPHGFHDAMVAAKHTADLGNATLAQLVLAGLMHSGDLERHLRLLRRRHMRRRDAMLDAVGRLLPGAVVHGAAAGLHLTITFTGPMAEAGDTELAAAALERGVKVQPLSWHRQRPGEPGLVLGYAANPPSEIEEGIRVVAEVRGSTRRKASIHPSGGVRRG